MKHIYLQEEPLICETKLKLRERNLSKELCGRDFLNYSQVPHKIRANIEEL